MSNSLDLDQALHFVGPDLGPNCLKRLVGKELRVLKAYMVYLKHELEAHPLIYLKPTMISWCIHG